jgi:hypothetical protein
MGSLLSVSFVVNSLRTSKFSDARRLKRAAWSGARCERADFDDSSFVIWRTYASDNLVRFRIMASVSLLLSASAFCRATSWWG